MDSQEVIVRKAKNPLTISPNLDALLEHDERTRPRVNVPKSPVLPAPGSTPSSEGSFVGLPPPPRGPRRTVVKVTEKAGGKEGSPPCFIDTSVPRISTGGVDTGLASGATANPFINPAPSLEILLKEEAITPPSRSSSTVGNKAVLLPDHVDDTKAGIGKGSKTEGNRHGSRPHTISLSNEGRRKRSKKANQQTSLSHSPTPTLPRAQEVTSANSRRTKTSKEDPVDTSRERARNRGKARLKDVSPSDGGVGKGTPIFSHGNDTSSESSNTTHGPYSTTSHEPRTSNTIYQSSAHSSSHHATNSTRMDSSRLSNNGRQQRGSRESFIELSSPTKLEYSNPDLRSTDTARPHTAPPQFMDVTYTASNVATSKPAKPPLPTTPKPQFSRVSPGQSTYPKKSVQHASPLSRQQTNTERLDHYPPLTTNFLSLEERAELVRRNRKLAKVFGRNLGADTLAQQLLHVPHSKSSQHRSAHSIDVPVLRQKSNPTWSQTEGTVSMNASGRRHSIPDDSSSFSQYSFEEREAAPSAEEDVPPRESSRRRGTNRERRSVTSFIDLSDGDSFNLTIDSERCKHRAVSDVTSSSSMFENMTQDEQADEERRRKREKLAKLHRFLGSRVPTDLALGLSHFETPLPAALPRDGGLLGTLGLVAEEETRIPILRRRRSSSVVALPTTWSDDIERLKEDLSNREKAVNVRRAVKMEKVFGVQPPQTLFHTRNSPSPSHPQGSGPTTPTKATFLARAAGLNPSVEASSFGLRKDQSTPRLKEKRPETSDSHQPLLPYSSSIESEFATTLISSSKRHSDMYSHYQHSLNSLHDILDRDDKQSLAELHEYLNSEFPQTLESTTFQYTNESSISATKAERRRSLPSRTSMVSLSSMLTVSPPEVSDFQLRRRRAAKLTHFFGVDYRDLIKDVLESIEKGVDDERKKGTLDPDEAEDLMQKLRNLRNKRGSTF